MITDKNRLWALERALKYIDYNDLAAFLDTIMGNWENHRGLLLLSLELTEGRVIEFGCGMGSTTFIRRHCERYKREFLTYDNNDKWAGQMEAKLVTNWDDQGIYQQCGVAFIDHAPGEHRRVAIAKFKDLADVIVVHDSETGGAGDYKLEPALANFKYRLNHNLKGGGAGATAVSNTVDLNAFRGLSLRDYKFDDY